MVCLNENYFKFANLTVVKKKIVYLALSLKKKKKTFKTTCHSGCSWLYLVIDFGSEVN